MRPDPGGETNLPTTGSCGLHRQGFGEHGRERQNGKRMKGRCSREKKRRGNKEKKGRRREEDRLMDECSVSVSMRVVGLSFLLFFFFYFLFFLSLITRMRRGRRKERWMDDGLGLRLTKRGRWENQLDFPPLPRGSSILIMPLTMTVQRHQKDEMKVFQVSLG